MQLPGVFVPLGHRPLACLWGALAIASISNELFRIALVWLAVEAIGERAAYVSALSSAVLLIAAALGGRFLDHHDPRTVMVVTTAIRALAVLMPVIVVTSGGPVILGLAIAALGLAAAAAQFDPAVQASLPRLARTPAELLATNGLADGTARAARLIGPSLAGPLAALIPILHVFSFNAALMLVVWLLLLALPRLQPSDASTPAARGLLASMAIVKNTPALRIMFLASMVTNALWIVSITFGLALLVQERALRWLGISGIGAYSLLIAFYGFANIACNIVLASRAQAPSFAVAYFGQALGVVGFFLIGLLAWYAPAELMLPGLGLACMVIAVGGPMHDLRLLAAVQSSGPLWSISGVFRVRLITQHFGLLVGTLTAPALLGGLGTPRTVILMALIQALVTVLAWIGLRRSGVV